MENKNPNFYSFRPKLSYTFVISLFFAGLIYNYYFDLKTNQKLPKISILKNYKKILTLFTIPSPRLSNYTLKIHMYAINSWIHLQDVKIVVFSGELNDTIKKLYPPNIILYDKPLKTGYKGNPLIRDWFVQGVKLATTEYVGFINSDIVLTDRWYNITKTLIKRFQHNAYLLINRIDIRQRNQSLFNVPYDKVEEEFMHVDHLTQWGGDVFIFAKEQTRFNVSRIPDYVIGYCNWDNFLYAHMGQLDYAINYQVNPPVFHLQHGRNKCNPESKSQDMAATERAGFKYIRANPQWVKWRLNITAGVIYNKNNKSQTISIYDS